MSGESIGNGVAQGVASNLVTVALTTPQGQAAVVETVALAVAVVAAIAGIVYATAKVMELFGL